MDAKGTKILEDEIESIIQSIPEWAKYIPENDEIRRQITAIYHAVYGYVTSGIIAEDYLQRINALVKKFNIFSGKILGWSMHIKDDSSLFDYLEERTHIRAVKGNIESLINPKIEQELDKVKQERDAFAVVNRVQARQLDTEGIGLMTTVPRCLDWLDDEPKILGFPKYKRDTLRKQVQNYLNENKCKSIPKGGSAGTYYLVRDLATAFEKCFPYYSKEGYLGEFSRFAKEIH